MGVEPTEDIQDAPNGFEVAILAKELLKLFLASRRQGLSRETMDFYNDLPQ